MGFLIMSCGKSPVSSNVTTLMGELQLLACALASYTDMWRRPNEYPIPPTPEQLGSFADSRERAKAEPYYAAAQKRMGLLGNAIQDIQCYFFATIFEKFALRPLRAWCYIQQACSRLETRLLQRGERPWAAFRDTSPEDYHLEQRLFWSCFRAERQVATYSLPRDVANLYQANWFSSWDCDQVR